MYFDKNEKIYVAGHNGLVGSAICRELKKKGFQNVVTKTHKELDLEDANLTKEFIFEEKPKVVFLAAAKVGGIMANNSYPADFLISNLSIQSNVIQYSYKANVERLIFLGSSCIYPKKTPQPIKEEYLLSSELEPTNRPYALAKITGVEMCWALNRQFNTNYLTVMPSNLYGPDDNFTNDNSHVLPALIRKIHEAKVKKKEYVEIWGSGEPRREFLFVDDLSEALVMLMDLDVNSYNKLTEKNQCPIINIGSGVDIKIIELAEKIKEIICYQGDFIFNNKYPDGTMRKLLDIRKIKSYNWKPKTNLNDGIQKVYKSFLKNK